MRHTRSRTLITKLAPSAFVVAVGALGAFACGTADHNAIPPVPADDAGAGGEQETHVASAVNVCPHIDNSFITPQQIPLNVSAVVAVTASDPDSALPDLTYAWHATSGTFSASDKPVTDYNCSKIGAQQLTVTVTDQPGCSTELTINVACVAN